MKNEDQIMISPIKKFKTLVKPDENMPIGLFEKEPEDGEKYFIQIIAPSKQKAQWHWVKQQALKLEKFNPEKYEIDEWHHFCRKSDYIIHSTPPEGGWDKNNEIADKQFQARLHAVGLGLDTD